MIIELSVYYPLHIHFRFLAEQSGAKVVNVIEQITCKMLLYILEIDKDKEEHFVDLGFMTWIKNPEFQKYYLDTPEFKTIAEEYLKAQS